MDLCLVKLCRVRVCKSADLVIPHAQGLHVHTHTHTHTHTLQAGAVHLYLAHLANRLLELSFEISHLVTFARLPQAGAVHLYLAHLANRLLELSREDRAAHLITQALRQRVWEKKCGE